MYEKFNNKTFMKFALKLKKEKLWLRFKIMDYYFGIYNRTSEDGLENRNSLMNIYKCLKYPERYIIDCYEKSHQYKIFEDYGNGIPIKQIFDHFKV